MTLRLLTRRDFSVHVASFFTVFGVAGTAFGSGARFHVTQAAESNGLSHTAGAIHKEVVFNASRKRVYDALTDPKQFDRVVQLSENGKSMENRATQISPEVGGAFSLFGGYIAGRHIEMVPNERLIQGMARNQLATGCLFGG